MWFVHMWRSVLHTLAPKGTEQLPAMTYQLLHLMMLLAVHALATSASHTLMMLVSMVYEYL
jgi:hypothetical protein